MSRSSKYSRDRLAPIVASSRSLAEVMRKLGLAPNGGNHRMITARVRLHALDTSHFRYARRPEPPAPLDPAHLAKLVRVSRSVAEVCRQLGLPVAGRAHHDISHQIRACALDTSHFRGQGWRRGESAATHPAISRGARTSSLPDDVVFVANSPLLQNRALRRRLLALGWPYRCAWCGIDEWRGRGLVLHVDHINGVNNDNRLSNLRWLCPNCHSQTDTYCNRRR